MTLKKNLKRSPTIVKTYKRYLRFRLCIRLFGIKPFSPTLLLKVPRYTKERRKFLKMGGLITHEYPIISEYEDFAGTATGHYFHQDLLVAQFIYQTNPSRHVDVGSRIDGFVAHVASFRSIDILDIRDLPTTNHPNIVFRKADIMLDAGKEITDSLSCLHSIEHFGLGRYGDTINPLGHIQAFNNLIEMLKPSGVLYISFPISNSNEVHFNVHRVFHPKDIFSWAPNKLKLLRFDYVDDNGALHKNFDLLNGKFDVTYGCGIYTFEK